MATRVLVGSSVGAVLLSVGLLAQARSGAPAQAGRQGGPPVAPMLQTQRVTDSLFVISGGGGNSTVFVTQNNGVVVVDAKNPGVGKLLLEEVTKITRQPITAVINSHAHADHTGGNIDFPLTTRFVAHVNTR